MRDRFTMFSTIGKWRSPSIKPKLIYQSRVWGDMAIANQSTANKIY